MPLNLHKAETALEELLLRLVQIKGPAIAGMTEPYTYKDRLICKPRGMKCFPSMAMADRPRAGLFVSNSLGSPDLIEL